MMFNPRKDEPQTYEQYLLVHQDHERLVRQAEKFRSNTTPAAHTARMNNRRIVEIDARHIDWWERKYREGK